MYIILQQPSDGPPIGLMDEVNAHVHMFVLFRDRAEFINFVAKLHSEVGLVF